MVLYDPRLEFYLGPKDRQLYNGAFDSSAVVFLVVKVRFTDIDLKLKVFRAMNIGLGKLWLLSLGDRVCLEDMGHKVRYQRNWV